MSPRSRMATVGGLSGSFIRGQGRATLPQFPLARSLMLPPCANVCFPEGLSESPHDCELLHREAWLSRPDVWDALALQGHLHPTPGGLGVAVFIMHLLTNTLSSVGRSRPCPARRSLTTPLAISSSSVGRFCWKRSEGGGGHLE